jgi:hypothetical protein
VGLKITRQVTTSVSTETNPPLSCVGCDSPLVSKMLVEAHMSQCFGTSESAMALSVTMTDLPRVLQRAHLLRGTLLVTGAPAFTVFSVEPTTGHERPWRRAQTEKKQSADIQLIQYRRQLRGGGLGWGQAGNGHR